MQHTITIDEEKTRELRETITLGTPHTPHQPRCKTRCCFVLKPLVIGILSAFAAAPGILYSLTYPSGIQPKAISYAWLYSMSSTTLFMSVISAVATLIYNLLTNIKYIPNSWESVKHNLRPPCSCSRIFKNAILILLGVSAAIVAGFTGFNAFTWTYSSIRTTVGIANFLVYAARRYEGVTKLLERIYQVFNADRRFQASLIDRMHYIKPEIRSLINQRFANTIINENTTMEFLNHIDYLNRLSLVRTHTSIFLKKTGWNSFKKFLTASCWLLLASFAASVVMPINTQNGFDGTNIFFNLLNHSLDSLANIYKIMIGFLPGLTNSIFYFISILNCSHTIANLSASLKRDHSFGAIAKLILILTMNALTTLGYITIAVSVTEQNNIFDIQPGSDLSHALNYDNYIATFIVALNNVENFILSKKPFKKSYHDYILYLEQKSLTTKNISALRQCSFFSERSQIFLRPPPIQLMVSSR